MMDSIRKASQQRTLIVYTLLFSLCSTGRCFQVFVFSFSSSIFFERSYLLSVARVENRPIERFFSSRENYSETKSRQKI